MRQSERLHTPKALVHYLLLYSLAEIGVPGVLGWALAGWLCSARGAVTVSQRKTVR